MTKIMCLLVIYFLLLFAPPSYAGKPASGLDKEPSVDAAAVVNAPAREQGAASKDNSGDDGEDVAPAPATPEATTPVVEPGSSYVYDLKKLIIKSRENIKRVNEKIKEQAVIKRNQKREERARAYYEQGLELQAEGKFDQAREYFEKAIRITEHPEMVKYIDQSAAKMKAQEHALKSQEKQQLRQENQERQAKLTEAATAYAQAVAFFKEKKYKEAKEMFNHVQELQDNYKGTLSYLRIIDQYILESEAAVSKHDQKETQRQSEEAQKARQREKEAWRKEIDIKEKERKNQINAQAQKVYKEAVSLYKSLKFMEAKKKFQEVEWVVPDYKATRNYIARADKDMAAEQARIERVKAKELALEQWQEEVERGRKAAMEKKAAQEKEKQRLKQLEEQVGFVYQGALSLYGKKEFDGALEKFNDAQKLLPGFKSTLAYIAKITLIKEREKKRQEEEAAERAKTKARDEERRRREEEQKHAQADHHSAARRDRQANAPAAKAPAKTAAMTREQEIDEAKAVQDLARQSQEVMRQISQLSDDKRIAPVQKKMARVENVLNRIKAQKENILRQLREEAERERQRQLKIARDQLLARVQDEYDQAIMMMRNKNDDTALPILLKIENDLPNFKKTRWYLEHIKDDQQQAERQAVLERTRREDDRLKILEEKRRREETAQKAAEAERTRAEEERRRQLRAAQESEMQALADKAGNLNDQILAATKSKDFASAKASFQELEKVLGTLEALKRSMAQDDLEEQRAKEKFLPVKTAPPAAAPAPEMKPPAVQEKKTVLKPKQAFADARFLRREQEKERRREIAVQQQRLRAQRAAQEKAKREEKDYAREEMQRQKEETFDHAVALYRQKKFAAAKVIFDGLAQQHVRGAEAYLRKIDRHFEREAARSTAADERLRSEFIAEEVRKQRLANILAQREREHQRALTLQLERQTRIAQEEDQRQKIRVEALKQRERDRQRLERQRAREQNKRRKAEEELQFRKISPAIKPEPPLSPTKEKPVEHIKVDESIPAAASAVQPVPVVAPAPPVMSPAAVASALPVMDAKTRQARIDFSNKRKNYLEKIHAREEKEKQEQARKQEIEKRRQDLIKARQEEQKRKEEAAQRARELKAKEELENKKQELQARQQEIEKNQREMAERKKAMEQRQQEKEKNRQEMAERKKAMEQRQQEEIARRKKEADERMKAAQLRKQEAIDRRKKQDEERRQEIERRRQIAQQRKEQAQKDRQEALERKNKEKLEREQRAQARRLQEAQDKERREQARQEEQRRWEQMKIQQEQEMREKQRRDELARQAREHQQQLEAERKDIEQRLAKSAQAIYDEGLALFKNGDNGLAYKKFKDLEDVMPNFKSTRQYMAQAKERLDHPSKAPDQPAIPAATKGASLGASAGGRPAPKEDLSPPVSREDAIKKTLEVFDTPPNGS